MWLIGLFQLVYFSFCKFDIQRGDGLFEVVHSGRADNGGINVRFAQYPRQRDLGAGGTASLCDVGHRISHSKILLTKIQAVPKRIAIRPHGLAASTAFSVARKEATRQRLQGISPMP